MFTRRLSFQYEPTYNRIREYWTARLGPPVAPFSLQDVSLMRIARYASARLLYTAEVAKSLGWLAARPARCGFRPIADWTAI